MKEISGEATLSPEKKGEIIDDSDKIRRIMQSFWAEETDLEFIKKNLDFQEKAHLNDLLNTGHEMEALRKIMERKKEKLPIDSFQFLFASQNETKRRMVEEASREQKSFLQRTIFSSSREEEEQERRILRQLIREYKSGRGPKTIRDYGPQYFALDVAETKVLKMHETDQDQTIIGADIVVLCGGKIMEKPKSKEELLETLKSVSGKKIRVSFGVVLLTSTVFGKRVTIKEGGYFDIKLRNFSEKEASDYFNQYGKSCFEVAGGIDYASSGARKLISSDPVQISTLRLGGKTEGGKKSILISPDVLPELKDYFTGTPKELISETLKRARLLQGS